MPRQSVTPPELISRILIGVFIVFLAFVPGATAVLALADGGLRDRAPSPPSKPSGLTVVSRTSSSLGISWNASASGVSYRVYLGSKRVASTTATAYTFTGLACAKSYRMGVDAVRAAKKLCQGVGFGYHTCLFLAASAAPPLLRVARCLRVP